MTNNSFISIDSLVRGWLLRRGKTIHTYYKAMSLATEAVLEMALSSMPMVKVTFLKRDKGAKWFTLPSDYTGWVAVGIRKGSRWLPVAVTDTLIGSPVEGYTGDSFAGAWGAWSGAGAPVVPTTFAESDFESTDFVTDAPPPAASYDPVLFDTDIWHTAHDFAYANQVRIDEARGVVICPDNFTVLELYLEYQSVGKADTLTKIPIAAKASIDAYMDWKYEAYKRNGRNVSGLESEYEQQHLLYRARRHTLTIEDIRQVIDRSTAQAVRENGIGSGGVNSFTEYVTVGSGTTSALHFIEIVFATPGTTGAHPALAGKTPADISSIRINGVAVTYSPADVTITGTAITFTNGTTFLAGDVLKIFFV